MIQFYMKGSLQKLSDNFSVHEFDCPCSHPECRLTLADSTGVSQLQAMRDKIKKRITIDRGGGMRCRFYQKELFEKYKNVPGKTVERSTHELGCAWDISVIGMNGSDLEKIARECGFRAVGVAKTWIHVDVRDDAEREWVYK